MAPKTKADRLFGAACVRIALERSGRDPAALSLYEETLLELGVTDREVGAYLDAHRADVERRLDAHGGWRRGGR